MKQAWVRTSLVVGLTGLMLAGYQNCSANRFDATPADRTSASVSGDGTTKDPGLPATGGGTVTDNPKPTIDIGMNTYDASVMSGGAQICVHEIKLIKAKLGDDRAKPEEVIARTVPNGFGGLSVQLATSRSVAQEMGDVGVNIVPQGTLVATLPFPLGNYAEVQFTLKPGCAGSTLNYVNAAGKAIAVTDATTLKFKGAFNLTPASPQLILNVQPLMLALAKAKDAKEAKDALDNGCADY